MLPFLFEYQCLQYLLLKRYCNLYKICCNLQYISEISHSKILRFAWLEHYVISYIKS